MIIDDKYSQYYTVPSSFMDGKGRFTPIGFVTVAQDLAGMHYGAGGNSILSLQKNNLTWVISKQHFEISEYPLWMDSLIIQTWAQKPKGFFCFRDFAYYYKQDGKKPFLNQAFTDYGKEEKSGAGVITEEALNNRGALCMRGSSCWIPLDMVTGQPVKPDEKIMGTLTYNSDCMEGKVFTKIPPIEKGETEEIFMPSILDIDMNGHVNNLNYVRWVLSFMNAEFCSGKLLCALDTNFISSAKYGEKLTCRCTQTAENTCVHSIVRMEDGSEVFRAMTKWTDEKNISRPLQTNY